MHRMGLRLKRFGFWDVIFCTNHYLSCVPASASSLQCLEISARVGNCIYINYFVRTKRRCDCGIHKFNDYTKKENIYIYKKKTEAVEIIWVCIFYFARCTHTSHIESAGLGILHIEYTNGGCHLLK